MNAPAQPKSLLDWLRCFGPGAILASLTIGVGELVFSTRAGALFGYRLLWVFALVLFFKWLLVYSTARHMAITGAHIAWKSHRGEDDVAAETDDAGPTDWKSVAIIAAGLIAHMNLLKPLGFVPAGLILFWSVAFAFGSRRYGRDIIVGLLLALFAYIGFTYGLGLQLPPGILKGLL